MRKPNYYNQALHVLQQLHISYPQYNMGRHLATALDEYGDVWGLSDKELTFALNKYKSQLDMDIQRSEDVELDRIIKQGLDLDNILKEEDNGDY